MPPFGARASARFNVGVLWDAGVGVPLALISGKSKIDASGEEAA
jgi:hypothetical protein